MEQETTGLVLASIDDCLRVGNRRWLFIEWLRERAARRGLNASYRTWLSRYDDWMNPDRDRHHYPLYAVEGVIAVAKEAPFVNPWLGQEARVRRERGAHSDLHREDPHGWRNPASRSPQR